MKDHYEPLPDEWRIKAYKEIFKNISDKEYIKKIDAVSSYVYHNDIKFQCTVIITSSNKYFKIYPDKLIFRPNQMYKKEQVLLTNNLNFIFNNFVTNFS